MGKLKENKNDKISSLPRELSDEEFNQWIHGRFLEEAADIEKELDSIPDSKDWKPTEEKFQRLMSKAREQGFFTEADNSASNVNVDDREKSTKEEKLREEKLNMEKKKDRNVYRKEKGYWRRRVMKYAAYAAVTLIGIFGVSMSSEANRTYVMQEVNRLVGNDVSTKVNNSDVVQSNRTEAEAFKNIEDTFGITLPQLFYKPSGLKYEICSIDAEAQIAIFQYNYNGELISWLIYASDKQSSKLSSGDSGRYVDSIVSTLTPNLEVKLWEIEENDEKNTYMLQWKYKNVYYEVLGKISVEEMKKIAEKIMY